VTPRLAAIVEVLAGLKSVSAAARSLGLSRNHFQSILHRAVLALVESIAIKPGGRPRKSSEVATLQAQLKRLQRDHARLSKQVDSTHRLLEVAGGLLHGRIRPSQRRPRTRKSEGKRHEPQDSEPDDGRRGVLEGVDEMRRLGLSAPLAAAIAGVNAATVRRWRAHVRDGGLAYRARPRARPISRTAASTAEQLVRQLHGLIGAEALRHSVAGLSRRAALGVKAQTLSAMERERKASLQRLTITQPGVVRGFDAMYFATASGPLYALIGADGAVPYRTSLTTATHYNAQSVARALVYDLENNGAPLVLRCDRARAHATPAVRAILAAQGVLVLQGPPHYPRFYGQLERQNREHRRWMATSVAQRRLDTESSLHEMLHCVNDLWPRRTLQWHTAAEAWNARPRLTVDRQAFREEVNECALTIAHQLHRRDQPANLAERLGIERTLERMGYLRQELGGWC
jgi:transposase